MYITQPWLLIFVAAIVALHVVTYFIPKLRLPLTFVNVLVHTAAAAAIIIAGGEIEEFVLLLLMLQRMTALKRQIKRLRNFLLQKKRPIALVIILSAWM